MKQLIGYCGIDCETCPAYRATQTDDNELREKTAAQWSELYGEPITADMITCDGCRTKGRKTTYCENQCDIRTCADTKQYTTCGDCFSLRYCTRIKPILANNPLAIANLTDKQ